MPRARAGRAVRLGSRLSEWPDGTATGRCEFTHALYVEVLQGLVCESTCRRSSKTPEQTAAMLGTAYAYNAFADHFLTDLFASGHLRTSRLELREQCTLPVVGGLTGDLLARFMHDEDCPYGLTVHNARGDTRTGYGDKRLRDDPDVSLLGLLIPAYAADVPLAGPDVDLLCGCGAP